MLNPRETKFLKNLSEQEICELREAFDIFDDDSDGSITKEKLHLLLSSLKQFSSEDEYNKLIETIGIKNCNRIDFNQFLIMMAKKTQNTQVNDEKYLKKLFDALDKNHNGRISIHEIRYIVKNSNSNISKQEIEFLIEKVDSDGDGLISFDEFLSFMQN